MKLKRIITIFLLPLFAVTLLCSTSFSTQGTLTGQVVDGFDKVVKDVEVKIKGTEFATKTDENGQYSIKYNSGKIVVTYRKKGYARQASTLNIRETSVVPIPRLTLWKYPESGGVFLIRMEDYKKIEYASFYSERNDSSISFYVKGKPTGIECPDEAFEQGKIWMMMLDYSKDEPVVVGKSLYKVGENNLLGEIVFKSDDWAVENIGDKYSEISSRVGLRYITLEPGKYCYCIGQLTLKSKIGFGYYFEIVDPGLSEKEEK
ncbi:MAG: carboxypeptidase regulatory-like domain-containing protein [Candidatus Scalindua sp.]|nr:carboxypeptidase regulatory-like domain-containing protein [Candidatus Scalindua sp.]